MKTTIQSLIMVAVTSWFVTTVEAQTSQISSVIGTYQGAILPVTHPVPIAAVGTALIGPSVPQLISGLFTYSLTFNQLGYHEGSVRSGVVFSNGRVYNLTGDLLVEPFPNKKNTDAKFTFRADGILDDVQGITGVSSVDYIISGTLVQTKAEGDYISGLYYEDLAANSQFPYIFITTGNNPIAFVSTSTVNANVEVRRVSNRANAFFSINQRKIQR